MDGRLSLIPGLEWSAPRSVFEQVLGRIEAQLPANEALASLLRAARGSGSGDLSGLERAALEALLLAAQAAYADQLESARAQGPGPEHDLQVSHLGSLLTTLESHLYPEPLPPEAMSPVALRALGRGLHEGVPQMVRVLKPLMARGEDFTQRVLLRVLEVVPDAEAGVILGANMLSPQQREELFLAFVRHPREELRFHLFRLLGRNEKLPSPGALRPDISENGTRELLQAGLRDPSPRVRQRAIAYAYGLRRVAELREAVMTAPPDTDEDARSYGLLAMGLMDDAESLQRLERAFREGTRKEVTAATWALARRPDGVARVVAAVDEVRPEVRPEAVGALMHVSAPLTAEQLAWLSAPERRPEVREAAAAYRRRMGKH